MPVFAPKYKRISRPPGAFRVLVYLLYGKYSEIRILNLGYVELLSIRKLARLLGTESKKVNQWLGYLENNGYISNLQYSPDRRTCKLILREPSNYVYRQITTAKD